MRTENVISVTEKVSPSISSAVMAVFISMLLSAGFTFMYGTAFELEFSIFPAIIVLFLSSLGFTIAHYQNKAKLSTGVLIAAPLFLGVMLIFNWFEVRDGLLGFLYYVKYYAFYWFPGFYVEPEDGGAAVIAFITAYNMINTCSTTFVLLRRRFIPAALLNFLPLFICSVANVVMRPSQIPCLITAAGIFLLLLTHALRFKKQSTVEKSLLMIALPVLALTLMTAVIFPEEKYGQDKLAKNIIISLQERVEESSGKNSKASQFLDNILNGFRNPNSEGGTNFFSPLYSTRTDLSHVGPFDPPNDRIMTVSRKLNPDYNGDAAPYNGHILYLKVESLDKYENNKLSSTKMNTNIYADDYEPSYEEGQYELTITPLTDSGVDISPFYTDFYSLNDTENPVISPYNYTNTGISTFAASPVPVKTGNIYSEWYLDWYVYKNALTVPKATENALTMSGKLPDWYMEVYMGHIEMSDAEKVRRVTEFVRDLHPYDENTPVPPEDVDFVPWFVSEAESGICVHYAITSVILLRMIGVPARYVRGYVDTRSYNNTESVIYANQAHAWFEFFVPEYGWIMGDSTPGYGSDAANFNIDAVARTSPEINNAAFSKDHYTAERERQAELAAQTSETTTEPEETTAETEETTPSGTTPTPPAGQKPQDTAPSVVIVYDTDTYEVLTEETNKNSIKLIEIEKTIVKTAAAIIFAFMAIALIVLVFKLAFTVFWLEKFKTEKINEKAIAYYHYFGLMGRIFRFDIPVKASDIAEKAAFSNGEITPDEYKKLVTSCREHMKECAGGFPKIKQSVFRLFEIDIRDYK
jgi:transglutaminase-like putative cysteine protease